MFIEQIRSGLDLFRIPPVSPLGAGIEKPSDDHAGLADNLESWVLFELHRADRSAHISIPRGRGRTRIVGDFPRSVRWALVTLGAVVAEAGRRQRGPDACDRQDEGLVAAQ
jgi:hypothetical protein